MAEKKILKKDHPPMVSLYADYEKSSVRKEGRAMTERTPAERTPKEAQGEQIAARFREVINLGEVCAALLAALGHGESLEDVVEVAGRKYRITTQFAPVKIVIEPTDN